MYSFKTYTQNYEQFIDILMLEALSPEQEAMGKRWAKEHTPSSKVDRVHDEVFGGSDVDRVTIPLERAPRDHSKNPIHNTIKSHLEPHGFSISDYDKGSVTDKHGRETTIGKALGRTKADPALMQKFNNDPSRQSTHAHSTGKSITISRHPLDIFSMSTGRKWDNTSCMRIGSNGSTKDNAGCNRRFIKSDLNHGTLAAYLHDNDDKNLENPHSRVLLKRFDSGERDDKPIFRPEGRIYGDQNTDIRHTLNKWAEKHYPAKEDAVYAKHKDLYNDDGNSISVSPKGAKKFNPKVLERYVDVAQMSHDVARDNNKGWDDYEPVTSYVNHNLTKYRGSLPHDQQLEFDKHAQTELAKRYHENETTKTRYGSNPHWNEYTDGDGDSDLAKMHFFAHDTNIHPQHVDEIAKNFVDSHKTSHGNHTTAENKWEDLEDAVLDHGSDESKADILKHHGTYGYDEPDDSNFDPNRHIVGKHTAREWAKAHIARAENYGRFYDADERTHANMAKHADDETFHNWLHDESVAHDSYSYKAMAKTASTKRQHKMLDDLKFDNSEHNGDVDEKIRGIREGSRSKSVLARIIGDKHAPKDVRRDAIHDMRYDTANMTESKQ